MSKKLKLFQMPTITKHVLCSDMGKKQLSKIVNNIIINTTSNSSYEAHVLRKVEKLNFLRWGIDFSYKPNNSNSIESGHIRVERQRTANGNIAYLIVTRPEYDRETNEFKILPDDNNFGFSASVIPEYTFHSQTLDEDSPAYVPEIAVKSIRNLVDGLEEKLERGTISSSGDNPHIANFRDGLYNIEITAGYSEKNPISVTLQLLPVTNSTDRKLVNTVAYTGNKAKFPENPILYKNNIDALVQLISKHSELEMLYP